MSSDDSYQAKPAKNLPRLPSHSAMNLKSVLDDMSSDTPTEPEKPYVTPGFAPEVAQRPQQRKSFTFPVPPVVKMDALSVLDDSTDDDSGFDFGNFNTPMGGKVQVHPTGPHVGGCAAASEEPSSVEELL